MKEVNIFIRVNHKTEAGDARKHMRGFIIFRYGQTTKENYIKLPQAATPNQAIIHTAAAALSALKEPCHVNLYTQTNFGYRYMENRKKWVNREHGDLLLAAIEKGGHDITYIDCASHHSYQVYQNALRERLIHHMDLEDEEEFVY